MLGLVVELTLLNLVSCNKMTDTDESIILLGKESYVKPLMNMIPDSLQNKLPALFDSIPEGCIPPNIEGEYIIEKKFCHSNFIDLSDDKDLHLRVKNQHNRVAVVDFDEGGIVHTDTAFVMGTKSRFTLYFKEERNIEFMGNHSRVTRGIIFTGEKRNEGIKNLYFGNVILSATKGENPFIGTFIPGWYFIYKDNDGMSVNCDWFDQQGREADHE